MNANDEMVLLMRAVVAYLLLPNDQPAQVALARSLVLEKLDLVRHLHRTEGHSCGSLYRMIERWLNHEHRESVEEEATLKKLGERLSDYVHQVAVPMMNRRETDDGQKG